MMITGRAWGEDRAGFSVRLNFLIFQKTGKTHQIYYRHHKMGAEGTPDAHMLGVFSGLFREGAKKSMR